MPRGSWSKKDERMYSHIKQSCMKRGRSYKTCSRIGAATVNKRRSERAGLRGVRGMQALMGVEGMNPMLFVPMALVGVPLFIMWKIVR